MGKKVPPLLKSFPFSQNLLKVGPLKAVNSPPPFLYHTTYSGWIQPFKRGRGRGVSTKIKWGVQPCQNSKALIVKKKMG